MSERVVIPGWALTDAYDGTTYFREGIERPGDLHDPDFRVPSRRALAEALARAKWGAIEDPTGTEFGYGDPEVQRRIVDGQERLLKAIGMVHPSEEPATDD